MEKFGYEENDIGLNEPYIIHRKYIKSFISIDILPDGKIIKNNDESEGLIKNEDIQDLIQAGLVVKIND